MAVNGVFVIFWWIEQAEITCYKKKEEDEITFIQEDNTSFMYKQKKSNVYKLKTK